jgi:hypothetical protein
MRGTILLAMKLIDVVCNRELDLWLGIPSTFGNTYDIAVVVIQQEVPFLQMTAHTTFHWD